MTHGTVRPSLDASSTRLRHALCSSCAPTIIIVAISSSSSFVADVVVPGFPVFAAPSDSYRKVVITHATYNETHNEHCSCRCGFIVRRSCSLLWLSGLVVSPLGMRTRRLRFDSRVMSLFHWVATLGKLFTHIASAVSQLQETGVQKGSFRRLSGSGD